MPPVGTHGGDVPDRGSHASVAAMTESWTFAVARDDLTRTTVQHHRVRELEPGEALIRVDRVGMTANNVTYAVLGESLRYWQFFPPAERGLGAEWGVVPVWGFGEVAASTVDGVAVGKRLYGYLPSAEHLIVRPGRVNERGFGDDSAHRARLPSAYNAYAVTTGDPVYDVAREDLLVLYRPLFFTSFVLADQIADNGFYGADVVVISSASSKTAYGTAFELHGRGPRLVGLTSSSNVAFTSELGCYDQVLNYDAVGDLDASQPTVYVDVANRAEIRVALRQHLGARLVRDIAVGLTTQAADFGNADEFFFAPTQIRKRSAEWGRDGLDERFGQAWHRFAATVAGWVDITVSHGPDGLQDAWIEVLAGKTPPRSAHVITT
jgi:hypothetical protein